MTPRSSHTRLVLLARLFQLGVIAAVLAAIVVVLIHPDMAVVKALSGPSVRHLVMALVALSVAMLAHFRICLQAPAHCPGMESSHYASPDLLSFTCARLC